MAGLGSLENLEFGKNYRRQKFHTSLPIPLIGAGLNVARTTTTKCLEIATKKKKSTWKHKTPGGMPVFQVLVQVCPSTAILNVVRDITVTTV